MRSLIVGLGAGLAAALLDTLPMLARKMPARSIASAAAQWLVLGLVIAHLKTPLPPWANGLAAEAAQAPSPADRP